MKDLENEIGSIAGLPADTVRRYNNQLVRLMSLYLELYPRAIDGDMVEELARDCRFSRADAYAQYLAAIAGYDSGGRDRVFFEHWLRPAIYELDAAEYRSDPYFRDVGVTDAARGRWRLARGEYAPYEAFVFRDFKLTGDGRMLPQVGFFTEKYTYPAVFENGREWMTLQPNEITTHKKAIAAAHGRVLTFGLGLGYFAYHASGKENVESVTVVDVSEEVIALFREWILPRIPHREKLNFVCRDAFEFADGGLAGRFDYVYTDIWHDAGDGKALYLKMKEYEKSNPGVDFEYWLEETIRCYLTPELW